MTGQRIALTVDAEALLSAVRDVLAEHFATQVLARTIPVADMLEGQADQATDKERREVLRAASSTLASLAEPLGNGLKASIRRQFDQKLKPDQFKTSGTLTLDTLELVDETQVLEEIAIGKASMRLKEQVNFEFFSLSRRIGHLLDIEHIVDRDNPVFPGVFPQALIDALRHCGCVPAQRVVMFDAFAPMLIEILPGTYQLANDYLIQRGVLIEIKESYGRAILGKSAVTLPHPGASAAAAAVSTQVSSAARTPDNDELVALLSQVLQIDAAGTDERKGLLQRAFSSFGGTSIDGPVGAENNALHSRLRSQMRIGLEAQSGLLSAGTSTSGGDDASTSPPPNAVLSDNFTLAQLVTASVIVGAFNRLLAAAPIREHVGALLLAMQAPVIKAAFALPELLTDSAHPARKALDRLIEFAIAQPALLQPGTPSYESLALIIDDFVVGQKYDTETFAAIADKIETLFAYHEETAAENDPKANMLLEIELVESAINSANHAIESRLNCDAPDPEFICIFVRVIWKEVLFNDMLNGGPSGELWQRDIETLEALLKSIRPQDTIDERAELLRSLPLLQSRLDDAAQGVQAESQYLSDFMQRLRATHAESLSGALRRAGSRAREEALKHKSGLLARTSQLKATGQFSAMPHLVRGHWVEFIDEASGKRRRARLNWMSPIGAVCLFKDYMSGETFTVELDDLSEQLDQKRARLVGSLGVSRHAIEFAIRNLGIAGPALVV